MLTVIQQVGYCYLVFCRYASFTGNFHAFLAHKSAISPPTSAFVIIFNLNLGTVEPQQILTFDWNGEAVWERQNTLNLLK